ncbi:hypothetical protein JW926_04300 [Candidatus Sumerlaeota bacterium]|nr:hypothetical protein [Candidatus Sumerlaeota bacterium]
MIEKQGLDSPLSGEAWDLCQPLIYTGFGFINYYIIPILIKSGNIRKPEDLPEYIPLRIWGIWALDLSGKITPQEAVDAILVEGQKYRALLMKRGGDPFWFDLHWHFFFFDRMIPYLLEKPIEQTGDVLLAIISNPEIDTSITRQVFKKYYSVEYLESFIKKYGKKTQPFLASYLEDFAEKIIPHAVLPKGTSVPDGGDLTYLVKPVAQKYMELSDDDDQPLLFLERTLQQWKTKLPLYDDVKGFTVNDINQKLKTQTLEEQRESKYMTMRAKVWCRIQIQESINILDDFIHNR